LKECNADGGVGRDRVAPGRGRKAAPWGRMGLSMGGGDSHC